MRPARGITTTRWRWRGFALRALVGLCLIGLSLGIHWIYVAGAQERVANGVAVTGKVASDYSRGPATVVVRYEHGSTYETTLRHALGDLFDGVAGYAEGEEVTVYVDPDDPSQAALPGGYTSDVGFLTSYLPIPLLVWGCAVVVMTAVRRFRHRILFDSDLDGPVDLDELPDLSVSIAIPSEAVRIWSAACERIAASMPQSPGMAGLRVRVRFHTDRPELFLGVRVGPLSRRRRLLVVEATVPPDQRATPDQALRTTLAEAVEAAIEFAERRRLATRLPDLRAFLRKLPSPSSEPDEPDPSLNDLASPRFTTSLRGYDSFQVNEIDDRVRTALASTDPEVGAAARSWLRAQKLRVALRGYDREQVDAHLRSLEEELARPASRPAPAGRDRASSTPLPDPGPDIDKPEATAVELPGATSVTLRRHDFLPYGFVVLVIVGLAFAAIVTWPLSIAEVGAYTGTGGFVGVVSYVGGPSVYTRVTGNHILVANMLMLHEIPRGSVNAIVCDQLGGVRVGLHTGGSVRVSAFDLGFSSADRTYRDYLRRGQALERALARVPPEPTGGDRVARRFRYSNPLVMTLGMVLLLLTMFSTSQI